jgi:predicted TIM-barrel fold metal-dependent hydrolase
MPYEIKRFPFPGTIDADGHILEPPDLWENYLEPSLRARAIRVRLDEEGYEYLEIDGKPSSEAVKSTLAVMGAMGDEDLHPRKDRRYAETMPFGAGSASERLRMLEMENLDAALLYPTLGLLWERDVTDPQLSLAYCRAYNRWIADFCRGSKGKLIPIAHLTLLDPEGSARELERAVKDGCKGGWISVVSQTHKIHGDPWHDPLYRACEELDVPLGIHPTFIPYRVAAGIFEWPAQERHAGTDGVGGVAWGEDLWTRAIAQQAFVSMMALGALDRFPRLRLGILEFGSGWIGPMLDRLDAFSVALSRHSKRPKASEYFRRQCFISGDPDETTAPLTIDHVGSDCFVWATDFPHPDHPHTWVDNLTRFAEALPAPTRAKVLGDNVKRIYKLD